MEEKLKALQNRAAKSELAAKQLLEEVHVLTHPDEEYEGGDNDVHTAKYTEVAKKNASLKYQLTVLKRAIAAEKGEAVPEPLAAAPNIPDFKDIETSPSLYGTVVEIFRWSLQKRFGKDMDPAISVYSAKQGTGDYQCNAAMAVFKDLKGTPSAPASPKDVALQIVAAIPKNDIIESMEVAGPGFINIVVNSKLLSNIVTKVLQHGLKPPKVKRLRVGLDFSSPNIAKEMHVGHLRSTIIGDFFARFMEFLQYDVLRINHLGDWGTQFGMLIAHLKQKFPDYATVSPPIGDLQSFYKESKKRFDEEPGFNKIAHEEVVKLQSGSDPLVRKAWEMICDVSRKEFEQIYQRLDTHLTPVGESFYQSRMNDVFKLLEDNKLLQEDHGRYILWTKSATIPLIIKKSDGGFTYDTSDLATIRYRIFEEKCDWLVYVIDSGQSDHMQMIFQAARELKWLTPKTRVDHVGFGLVLGSDKKKFKTRSGETVRLRDLLDEGVTRATERLQANTGDKAEALQRSEAELKKTAEALAYGCIKYADLSHNRTSDYEFSFDKMLSDKGNTACYLLYSYARIKSIFRQPEIAAINLAEARKGSIVLENPKERKLALHIAKFSEVIERILKELMPNVFCDYLYELSCIFTEFYDSCYVISKARDSEERVVNVSRVLLCDVTLVTMTKCFEILGIRTLDRM